LSPPRDESAAPAPNTHHGSSPAGAMTEGPKQHAQFVPQNS